MAHSHFCRPADGVELRQHTVDLLIAPTAEAQETGDQVSDGDTMAGDEDGVGLRAFATAAGRRGVVVPLGVLGPLRFDEQHVLEERIQPSEEVGILFHAREPIGRRGMVEVRVLLRPSGQYAHPLAHETSVMLQLHRLDALAVR